jgi:beta-carotene hydroxylase
MWQMHDRSDWRPLLNVFLILILAEIPFGYGSDWPAWVWAIWILGFSTMMSPLAVIIHNHEHHPVFKNFSVDRSIGLFRALAFGIPPLLGRINHNLNHHGNSGMEEDWCRASQAGRNTPGRYWRYVRNTFAEYWTKSFAEGTPQLENRLKRWLKIELAVTFVWAALHLAFSPKIFLLAFVTPRLVSYFNIILVNLYQHEYCDPKSKWNHSRNFTGPAINFFLYNNGFHTVHHNFPNLHWSKLPQEHYKHADKIDARLIEKSLMGYMARDFFQSLPLRAESPVNS